MAAKGSTSGDPWRRRHGGCPCARRGTDAKAERTRGCRSGGRRTAWPGAARPSTPTRGDSRGRSSAGHEEPPRPMGSRRTSPALRSPSKGRAPFGSSEGTSGGPWGGCRLGRTEAVDRASASRGADSGWPRMSFHPSRRRRWIGPRQGERRSCRASRPRPQSRGASPLAVGRPAPAPALPRPRHVQEPAPELASTAWPSVSPCPSESYWYSSAHGRYARTKSRVNQARKCRLRLTLILKVP